MVKFDQTKAKDPNRYEIIGIEKEATKVINQMFDLHLPDLNSCYSQGKFYSEQLDTYSEYGNLLCYFLNEANDLVFTFEDKEENYSSYYLDLSVWNNSNENPLKKI